MSWWDFYKVFTYAFELDPLNKKSSQDMSGAGISQPDAVPDIRQDGSFWGGERGLVRLRDTNDFIDLSTVTNRQSRYKEYERLRNVSEIESAMTIMSDEACLAGNTLISTPYYGKKSIKWLTDNVKDEFLVYCWDFNKNDFTLGWAFNPRLTKKSQETVTIYLDDGSFFTCTKDHRILLETGEWIEAGNIKNDYKLMGFYQVEPLQKYNNLKSRLFPRIFTHKKGWVHERQFIDEWRSNENLENYKKLNELTRYISQGLNMRQIFDITGTYWETITLCLEKEGFTWKEIKKLGKNKNYRRVINVKEGPEVDVYDLSVKDHYNFCGESVVFHNCQKGENDHLFEIITDREDVKEELEFLFFNKMMLNMDRRLWSDFKSMIIMGDLFWEKIIDIDNPKDGIFKLQTLPSDSMYRIETTKGKLVEFQQSKEGPDYDSLTRAPVTKATEAEVQQSKAIRFAPEQVTHMRIGDDRKTFYPYGQSLIEPARGPAHQLRLMEDAMVVYRLCLVGDTRIRTKNSWKYIKDIRVNDDTFSLQHEKGLINSKVTFTINNGIQETFKVRSKTIEIIGTKTHPILVCRDGVVQMIDIENIIPKKDKFVTVKNNIEKNIKLNKILKTNDIVNNLEEDLSTFMGYLIGNSKFTSDEEFELTDCKCLENYNKTLEKYFKNKNKEELIFNIVVKDRVPEWIFNAKKNIRRAFVKGLANIDFENEKWEHEFVSCNKLFIEDIKELWQGLGLCSDHICKENNEYKLKISTEEVEEYEIIESIDFHGKNEVYDFEVNQEEHNFVANGTCVSNTRAPERRVFYIDVHQLPPYKAEAFVERIKDQFRKKKVSSNKGGGTTANSIEERWHAPAQDEDFWVPIRPNSNTRIETLPGATNLGEIDDAVYFRDKLFASLNFPKNYLNSTEAGQTKMSLSTQDVNFARMIERLQLPLEDGILDVAITHLKLRGFPESSYKNLKISMTPPSDWKELQRAEVISNRFNNASNLKGSALYSDYDILTRILKHSEDEAEEIISKNKLQKLEELKMQVIAQNPQLLGVGVPGNENETEIGSEPGGPSPMLSPEPEGGLGLEQPVQDLDLEQPDQSTEMEEQPEKRDSHLPDPEEEDIKKYDLEIVSYNLEKDREEIDYSEN